MNLLEPDKKKAIVESVIDRLQYSEPSYLEELLELNKKYEVKHHVRHGVVNFENDVKRT